MRGRQRSRRRRASALPATPALATAFGFSGYSAIRGHGRGEDAARELTRAYNLSALRRGITLFGGTQNPPSFTKDGDEVRIDWTSYDAEVAPFLDGTAIAGGAHWTAVELREPGRLSRAQRRSYRRQWQEHFRERGWLDRLFRYVEDEPSPGAFGRVEEKAREVREDAPAVRRLVTTAWTDALPDVNQWTPLLNCVGEKSRWRACAWCRSPGRSRITPTSRSVRSSAIPRSRRRKRAWSRRRCAASPATLAHTRRCASAWRRASRCCYPRASWERAE